MTQTTENTKLLLRVFAEVESIKEADVVCSEILQLMATEVSCQNKYGIKEYWKITGYYEISIQLNVIDFSEDSFKQIMSKLGTGWQFHNNQPEMWAVWDFEKENTNISFCNLKVRWSNLEVIR